jgi:hypothetical protein
VKGVISRTAVQRSMVFRINFVCTVSISSIRQSSDRHVSSESLPSLDTQTSHYRTKTPIHPLTPYHPYSPILASYRREHTSSRISTPHKHSHLPCLSQLNLHELQHHFLTLASRACEASPKHSVLSSRIAPYLFAFRRAERLVWQSK